MINDDDPTLIFQGEETVTVSFRIHEEEPGRFDWRTEHNESDEYFDTFDEALRDFQDQFRFFV